MLPLHYYALSHRAEASDDARLTSVCLTSVAYIGPKSRTWRPRKTKIDTEVAHVTRDSDTTFKVKRSKVKVTTGRFTHLGVYTSGRCSSDRGNVFPMGTYCYVAVRRCRLGGARRFGAHRGRRGAGHIVAAPAQLVKKGYAIGRVCLSAGLLQSFWTDFNNLL